MSSPLVVSRVNGADCPRVGRCESVPVGGRIRFFLNEWRNIGASKQVLRWIQLGYPLRFKKDLIDSKNLPKLTRLAHPQVVTQYSNNQVKQQALDLLIQDLLAKRCIREMADHEVGYFSRVFLVPKKSGGWRLVIDLSQLNQSLAPVTFTMDTLAQVRKVLKQGMWATSIDLSDAYQHIPMSKSSQVYLCFQVGRKRYMYLVPPFGLISAPWLFTQVVKQLKKWAAKNNLALFQYLDDWLNLETDKQKN